MKNWLGIIPLHQDRSFSMAQLQTRLRSNELPKGAAWSRKPFIAFTQLREKTSWCTNRGLKFIRLKKKKNSETSWKSLKQRPGEYIVNCSSPGGAVVKNLPANAGITRDVCSIPGSRRSHGEGNGNPLRYSCLENSMDRRAWQATVHEVAKNQTQLSIQLVCTRFN